MITWSGGTRRLMMIVFGATLATSAIDLPMLGMHEAVASTNKSYQINGRWYSPHGAGGYDESGTASYYGPGFHGRKTANGETYDQWGMTAAHRTLPMGTQVYVTNQRTGKTVKVRINDRGPFAGSNRIIDLSTHVAQTLGISGLGQVRVRHAGLGAPSDDRRVIASKKKNDDDDTPTPAKAKAKVKVAAISETESKPKPKASPSSEKAEAKPATRPRPVREETRPARYKHEEKTWGGVVDASAAGGDPASARLVRQLETVAVAEVQAEWRKAVAEARKA